MHPISAISLSYYCHPVLLNIWYPNLLAGFRPSRLLVPSDNNVKSSYWNLGRKIWKRRIFTHEICGYSHTHNRLSKTMINKSYFRQSMSIHIDKSYYSDHFFLALTFSLYILTQYGLALSCIPQHSQNTLGIT